MVSIISTDGFTREEALKLIHFPIHHKDVKNPSITDLGVVVGVLEMNEEIEVIVKFHDKISQFTKSELIAEYVVTDD